MKNNNPIRWGATLDEWYLWAHLTNGGADLLPAVASPEGQVAPRRLTSSIRHLKELHKTPTEWDYPYVRGIKAWAQHVATTDDMRLWSANPDYNILLVTRNMRAIDIDISDRAFADQIEAMICQALGTSLPVRFRENSGNRTLIFRVDDPTPLNRRAVIVSHKVMEGKVVVTKQQAIELLASGQQTALCGTHPSGARFQWRGIDHVKGIPVVSLQRLAVLWDQLRNAYDPGSKPLIVPEEAQYEFVARTGGTVKNDPVLTWLEGEGFVKSYEGNGTANIRCPWEAEHSDGGNANATSWLPAGLGGKERGGFRCLHAHCADRNTRLFLDHIGYAEASAKAAFMPTTLPAPPNPVDQLRAMVAPQPLQQAQDDSRPPANLSAFSCAPAPVSQATAPTFEAPTYSIAPVVPRAPSRVLRLTPELSSRKAHTKQVNDLVKLAGEVMALGGSEPGEGTPYNKDPKTGKTQVSVTNLHIALTSSPEAFDARRDTFQAVDQISVAGGEWKAVSDPVITTVRRMLEAALDAKWSADDVGKGICAAADENNYDSAQVLLEQQTWDGTNRIKAFATDILKAEPSPYADLIGQYTWVALAARVLQPGCKADISPIFISPKQSTGKSSTVAAMGLVPGWATVQDLSSRDDDLSRALRGKCVVEIAELRGLDGRDASATKAYLTKTVDQWTPKYREYAVESPRRCLFIGTDNRTRMLKDPTGNRRWAPIRVAVTDKFCDHPRMAQSIDQYWAEAVEIIKGFPSPEHAVEHFSTQLRIAAEPYVLAATAFDPWHAVISKFVRAQRPGTRVTAQALFAILGGSVLALDHFKIARIRTVMTMMGLEESGHDAWRIPKVFPTVDDEPTDDAPTADVQDELDADGTMPFVQPPPPTNTTGFAPNVYAFTATPPPVEDDPTFPPPNRSAFTCITVDSDDFIAPPPNLAAFTCITVDSDDFIAPPPNLAAFRCQPIQVSWADVFQNSNRPFVF